MSDDFKCGMKIVFRQGEAQHDTLVVPNARAILGSEVDPVYLIDVERKVVLTVNFSTVLYIAPLTENEIA